MRRIGLFAALCVFVTAGISCGGETADQGRVVAYFEDVGDLVDRGQVQIRDVEIGHVEDIQLVLRDGRMAARVEMVVPDGRNIHSSGLRAVIRQTSLLGEQFVQLIPTSNGGPTLAAGRTTIPLERTDKLVDVESFLSDLSGFVGEGGLEDLNRFVQAQAVILDERGERFGRTLEELETFTGVLADRQFDLSQAIDHLGSATGTISTSQATLDAFLDSLEDANSILADQGDELGALFRSFNRFGRFNARFLAKHEDGIRRGLRDLRPILETLVENQDVLKTDITQLRSFFELFPQALGGGPGGEGYGDYIQAEAVLCEDMAQCANSGEKGDVPGQGS